METKYGMLVQTFGATPQIKVMEFFLINDWTDFSKSHVARETEVSRTTLDPILEELVGDGIITKTRSVGRAEMYQLDKANPSAKIMQELIMTLASMRADQEEDKLKQKITVKKQKAKR